LKTADVGSRIIAGIYSSVYAHPQHWEHKFSSTAEGHIIIVPNGKKKELLYIPAASNWQIHAIMHIVSVIDNHEDEYNMTVKERIDRTRYSLARANLGIVRAHETDVPVPVIVTHNRYGDKFGAIRIIAVEGVLL
jgi:hypothetical protein